MRGHIWSVLGAGAILALAAPRAHATADCKALMGAYDHASKLISLEDAQGVGDDSVYRAILHEMKIANYYQVRQLNLELMQVNKCPPPTLAVYPNEYMKDAIECATEQLKGNMQGPECDLAKWQRMNRGN